MSSGILDAGYARSEVTRVAGWLGQRYRRVGFSLARSVPIELAVGRALSGAGAESSPAAPGTAGS